MGWGRAATEGRASSGRTSAAARGRWAPASSTFPRCGEHCMTTVEARPSYDSDAPSPATIAAAAQRGDVAPIYCFSGERYLVDTAVGAVRAAVLAQAGAAASFNHDTFDLKESGLGPALGTARTLPMMA